MTNNWYPIIDGVRCTKCLECVSFCPHEVYVVENGRPSVERPENCIEFCRGCQRGACDFEAILFRGGDICEGEL